MWVRHLSTAEVREFVVDLVNAIRDATGSDIIAVCAGSSSSGAPPPG
jgi:hypothetical protein